MFRTITSLYEGGKNMAGSIIRTVTAEMEDLSDRSTMENVLTAEEEVIHLLILKYNILLSSFFFFFLTTRCYFDLIYKLQLIKWLL